MDLIYLTLIALGALAGYLYYRNTKLVAIIKRTEQLLVASTGSTAVAMLMARDCVREMKQSNPGAESPTGDRILHLLAQTERAMGKGYLEKLAAQSIVMGAEMAKEKVGVNPFDNNDDDNSSTGSGTRH